MIGLVVVAVVVIYAHAPAIVSLLSLALLCFVSRSVLMGSLFCWLFGWLISNSIEIDRSIGDAAIEKV